MEAASTNKILDVSFNQGQTTFLTATNQGFAIYRVDPLQKLSERNLGGGIAIAVQLYETNFIGLVGGGDNPAFPVNQFVLWNDYTSPSGEAIIRKVLKDQIVAVRLNHDVVAVVTRKNATIFSLKDMQVVYKVKTASNPDGVCDLGSSTGSVFLCPGPEIGTVNIIDYATRTERIISCCTHPLRTITLNTSPELSDELREAYKKVQAPDSLFATSSTEGTLIRVYDVASQTLIKELRRGSDACEIYSVQFSPDSQSLAVCSSKNKAHIFSLNKDFVNQSSRASFLGGAIGYFGSEWSSFGIEFSPVAFKAVPPGGPQFQTPVGPVRHFGSIFPTQPGKPNSSNDAFRLVVIACDGSYAIHDLQFKDHKSIPRTSGLLSELPGHSLTAPPPPPQPPTTPAKDE